MEHVAHAIHSPRDIDGEIKRNVKMLIYKMDTNCLVHMSMLINTRSSATSFYIYIYLEDVCLHHTYIAHMGSATAHFLPTYRAQFARGNCAAADYSMVVTILWKHVDGDGDSGAREMETIACSRILLAIKCNAELCVALL